VSWFYGLVAGFVGAVIGTFAGAAARGSLAKFFGRDLPAALVGDISAILLALATATVVS
jgi:uncharacterized membrane protein